MIQMKCKAQEMEHAIGPSAMNHGACQWFKALVIDQCHDQWSLTNGQGWFKCVYNLV